MIPFGLASLMTVSLPIARRATKCLVPGAAAVYLCNQGTGTALTDFSGNARDGTFGAGANAPTWGAQGVSYDGGDYIDISPVLAALKGAAACTLHIVCSTTTSAAHKGVLGSATYDTNANTIRIRDSTDGSVNADSIRIQATDGTGLNSINLPGRLTATPDLITVRYQGGTVLEARKGLSGAWTRNTTSIVAALNSLETCTTLNIGRFETYYRIGLDAFLAVYTSALTDAQVDQNCAAIAAILAPRGVTIT